VMFSLRAMVYAPMISSAWISERGARAARPKHRSSGSEWCPIAHPLTAPAACPIGPPGITLARPVRAHPRRGRAQPADPHRCGAGPGRGRHRPDSCDRRRDPALPAVLRRGVRADHAHRGGRRRAGRDRPRPPVPRPPGTRPGLPPRRVAGRAVRAGHPHHAGGDRAPGQPGRRRGAVPGW